MDFSFLRALRASVRLSLSSLKSDAKRLQRASKDVFGQNYPLSVCQEACARARGFFNWHEAESVLKRGARPGDHLFWKIHDRNRAHEAVFESIVKAELEMTENGPVIFVGTVADAVAPAFCLWAESMSAAELPGVLFVDTKHASLQDTVLWSAALQMRMDTLVDECRFLDAREENLSMAVTTSARGWVDGLRAVVPSDVSDVLERSAFWHVLLQAIEQHRDRHEHDGGFGIGTRAVYECVIALCGEVPQLPYPLRREVEAGNYESLAGDFKAYCNRRDPTACAVVKGLMSAVESKGIHLGTVLAHESIRRPAVVLFDSADTSSTLVASLVHSLYVSRWVGGVRGARGLATRPVLFFADSETALADQFISRFSGAHTCIVAGNTREQLGHRRETSLYRTKIVIADEHSIVHNGRRVRTQTEEPTLVA